ncbi:FUSC family protein [Actinophytocola glycyrrhizae]|uniref:Aromatic acid exporter family protein n=1 Tax=Actinophytocola glycyrrhizae TaxID=2044873 RepID=A0ABV9S0J4_9PSEU
MGLPILQCSIAAALAWLVATEVFGHGRPFFAPIAVVICIGVGFGQQRLRRVVELVVGVSVGIGVGDLLISQIGAGWWQLALVLGLAMTTSVLLGGGTLVTLQAASSAILVATLLPPDSTGGLDRMLDALIGGLLGLAAIALLPGDPPEIVRRRGQELLGELAAALTAAADAISERDRTIAQEALRRARTQKAGDDYRDALRAAREIAAISPLHRRQRTMIERYTRASEPVDLALRNSRVLLRRTRAALADDETFPRSLPVALRQLAAAATGLADALGTDGDVAEVREQVRMAATVVDAGGIEHTGFSATVVTAQLRSVAVDLLQATGLSHEQARGFLPSMG